LWTNTESKYGQGLNYREEVATELERWFDDHEGLQDELEQFIRRAWRTTVITPLRDASGNATVLQDAAE
jgi:hypothetical protein